MLRRPRQIADGAHFARQPLLRNRRTRERFRKYIMRAAFPDRPTNFDPLIINLKTAKRLLSRSSYLKAGGSRAPSTSGSLGPVASSHCFLGPPRVLSRSGGKPGLGRIDARRLRFSGNETFVSCKLRAPSSPTSRAAVARSSGAATARGPSSRVTAGPCPISVHTKYPQPIDCLPHSNGYRGKYKGIFPRSPA
jgi:hypothetical protein